MFLAQFHREYNRVEEALKLTAVSNAFPQRSGLILGAVTGAFDASSLPLVFYKLAYYANDGKPSL